MENNRVRNSLRAQARRLCDLFERYPHIFLTEDDVRIHLCALLLPQWGQRESTGDGDTSVPLHCEVRWYGHGRLKCRSDVVLLRTSSLRTRMTDSFRLPSKGYGFNIPMAIIEVKLRRANGESNAAFKASIERDRDKLVQIVSEVSSAGARPFCCIVALDKKDDLGRFARRGSIEVFYRFSA